MKSFDHGDIVVQWIEAYLSGRVSRMHVGGEHSEVIPKHSGVPQSSVIGPLLFLLSENDLPVVLEALTLLLADDIKMVTRRTQSMSLHSYLTAASVITAPSINVFKKTLKKVWTEAFSHLPH